MLFEPVAKSIGKRLQDLKGLSIGLRLARVATAGGKGHFHRNARRLGCLINAKAAGKNNKVGHACTCLLCNGLKRL